MRAYKQFLIGSAAQIILVARPDHKKLLCIVARYIPMRRLAPAESLSGKRPWRRSPLPAELRCPFHAWKTCFASFRRSPGPRIALPHFTPQPHSSC
jgi:hypothetical protein